jgi:hypothetical protein
MADINRDQVKAIVLKSLSSIADLPADPEAATFGMLNDTQKKTFLNTLKKNLNDSPYYEDNGSTSNTMYYDVDLTMSSFAQWPTVKDCIDWIVENQACYPV